MKVKTAFRFNDYALIAARDEDDFADFGVVTSLGNRSGDSYTFRDNGSNVLGVAHLDTVQDGTDSALIDVKGESVLLSPRLDDRLGVYIITRMLPKLGIKVDWLLTTGEEIGQSSAEMFNTKKSYNWAFSFDRAGTDVVLYHHDSKPLRKILRKAGFVVGNGIYSDLSFLDIGCAGINFGCGYNDPHGRNAYALLSDTFDMIGRFRAFYKRWSHAPLPYDPLNKPDSRYDSWRNAWSFHPKYDKSYTATHLDWYEVEDFSNDEMLENLADQTNELESKQ